MASSGIPWEENSEVETDSKVFQQLSPSTGKKKGHYLLLPQTRLRLIVLLLSCTNKPPWPLLPYISFQLLVVCYSRSQLFASPAVLCFLKQGRIATSVYLAVLSCQGVSLSGKCRAACSHRYSNGSCSKGLLRPGTKPRNFIWEVQAMHEATAPASGSIWYLPASCAAGSPAPTCGGAWRHRLYLLLLVFASNSNYPGHVCSCQWVCREPFPPPCYREWEQWKRFTVRAHSLWGWGRRQEQWIASKRKVSKAARMD